MANSLQTVSIKQFVADKGFTQIVPKVRTNSNGYPFLTFINAKNEAENVYFSKASAEGVSKDMPITKAILANYQIAETTNADGEKRTKLVGSGMRVELSDLLD